MLYGVLATIPTSTDLMAGLGAYSLPVFSDLLPFFEVVGGLIIGVGLIILLIKGIASAFHPQSK